MRSMIGFALLALGAGLAGHAQAQAPAADRQAALQARVFERFMERITVELRLDAAGRVRLQEVLDQSAVRRRAALRQSAALRQRMARALRDTATSDEEFGRILADLDALRARDQELWRQEQREIAAVLTPRQRAQFIMLFARFQEQVRQLRSRRPPNDRPPWR